MKKICFRLCLFAFAIPHLIVQMFNNPVPLEIQRIDEYLMKTTIDLYFDRDSREVVELGMALVRVVVDTDCNCWDRIEVGVRKDCLEVEGDSPSVVVLDDNTVLLEVHSEVHQ